jgi:hypothetical protein
MPADEIVLRLPALAESVPTARTRVRRFVRLPPNREDALALLVTELVGGMVTGGPATAQRVIELRLSDTADGVRVSVRRTDVEPDPIGSELGRDRAIALRLLDRLADRWGDDDGLRWVELRTTIDAGGQPAARYA